MDCSPPGSSVQGDSPGKKTSGLPCPPPGDPPDPWIKARSPASRKASSFRGKESACKQEIQEMEFDSWARKIFGRGNGNPLQHSCPGNPKGQRSLAGYSPKSHKGSDRTNRLSTAQVLESINPTGVE